MDANIDIIGVKFFQVGIGIGSVNQREEYRSYGNQEGFASFVICIAQQRLLDRVEGNEISIQPNYNHPQTP